MILLQNVAPLKHLNFDKLNNFFRLKNECGKSGFIFFGILSDYVKLTLRNQSLVGTDLFSGISSLK
jgi:hypothetical protein